MDTATDVEDFDFGTLGALRPGADEVPPPLPAGAIAPAEDGDGGEAELMAVPPPLPAPTGQRRGVRSALLWSGAGFLAGAVFWHAVGVWGSVSSAVLDGGPESEFARAEAAALPSAASLLAEAPRPGSEAAAGDAAPEMPFETTTTAEATEASPVAVAVAAPEAEVSQEPAKATETAALPELPQVTEPEPEAQKVATPEPQKVAVAEPEKVAAAEPEKIAAAEPQVNAPAEASAAPAEGAEKTKPETVYMVDPSNCTALVLDRSAKRTTTGPCPDGGLALRLESKGGREDLAGLASTLQPAGFSRD